jgi:hypothetical protein
MNNKKTIIIVVVIVVLCCCLVAAGVGGYLIYTNFIAKGNPSDVASQFLTDLVNKDYQAAWNLMTPGGQTEVGSVDKLAVGELTSWSFTNNVSIVNDTATVGVKIKMLSGGEEDTYCRLKQLNGVWKVDGFQSSP